MLGSASYDDCDPPAFAVPAVQAPLQVHSLEWAGQTVAAKLATLRQQLAEAGAGALLVTMLGECQKCQSTPHVVLGGLSVRLGGAGSWAGTARPSSFHLTSSAQCR